MKDTVALVTGASSGIGEAVARELARRGARVVLCARRAERLEAIAAGIRAAGGAALVVPCDVARDGQVEAAVAHAVAEWGRLDTVVANAGFGIAGRLEKLSLDEYRRQMETNFYGVIRTIRAALPELEKSRGRIGVVGSVNGFIATPGISPYCASKFAVRGLCDSIRPELRRHGISVTHLAPGFVASEIRLKDNREAVHDVRDPIPAWLIVPAAKAAREIVTAVARRRSERIVTRHGRILVFLARHLSWLVRPLSGIVDASDYR
jgi:NAD(P)-dependent dehydrogenase (short-subunit alcohol dehydrogenase family)